MRTDRISQGMGMGSTGGTKDKVRCKDNGQPLLPP
jgi:hypothetical protein